MSLQFKRSSAINNPPEPAHLAPGELAINLADKKLYTKNENNEIVNIGFNVDYAEETFLKRSGGNLTGPVVLFEGTMPTKTDEIVSKRYVDSKFGAGGDQVLTNGQLGNTYVQKSGSTMSGKLRLDYQVLAADDQYHAVNKRFTEGTYLKLTGGTVSNHIQTTAGYDASTAGNTLVTKDFTNSTFVKLSGDTMTGALTLPSAPTASNHAATKAYVDSIKTQLDAEIAGLRASTSTNIYISLTKAWPVGSIYTTVTAENPANELGFGSWVRYGEGRFLLSAGNGWNLGNSGGEYNHTLTAAEMPAHQHTFSEAYQGGPTTGDGDNNSVWTSYRQGVTSISGGNVPHNNMPPFIIVNMWRRVG